MNPAELSLTISPNLTKAVPNGVAQKNVAPLASKTQAERVNLEPLYTQLKAALGNGWTDYKTALSAFVLGSLNQAELSFVLQPLLSPAPSVITSIDPIKSPVSILHLHNSLLASLIANINRDRPPTEVAPWVVATDKPSSAAKNAGAGSGANDKAEERLKREVMLLHARDRKRIKSLKESSRAVNDGFREMQDYAHELAVKPPPQKEAQAEPQSATATGPTGAGSSGLAKTNFEIEIRRRYAATLASEAMEFPALADLQARIEPICYEEGLTGGVQQGALQGCADLLEQAVEAHIKQMLSSLLGHGRSNKAGGEGVQTNKFRKQLRKEDDDVERGILQRNAAGLLPVEMEMEAKRHSLDMQDLRLAVKLRDNYLISDHFLDESIMLGQYPEMDQTQAANGHVFGNGRPLTNGVGKHERHSAQPDPDAMVVDEIDYGGFKGVTKWDANSVMGALDECLLAGPG